jgi:hypothetical protein
MSSLWWKDQHAICKKDRGSLEYLPAAALVDRYALVDRRLDWIWAVGLDLRVVVVCRLRSGGGAELQAAAALTKQWWARRPARRRCQKGATLH